MYWNGAGTTSTIGLPDVALSLVKVADDAFEIHMDNNDVVSGFQFTIDDVPDYYTYTGIEATARVTVD